MNEVYDTLTTGPDLLLFVLDLFYFIFVFDFLILFKAAFTCAASTELHSQGTLLQKSTALECSSMVSIAPFGLGDTGSNPGSFAVLNLN